MRKIFFWISKIFTSKWVRSWNQKKIKTHSARCCPKKIFAPQFRYFLNVWNIKNLEYTFLIWAGNFLVKFWQSQKNFKIQNFFEENLWFVSKMNFPKKFFEFWNFLDFIKIWSGKKISKFIIFQGKILNVWNSQNLEYTILILASNWAVKFWWSQKNLIFLSPQFTMSLRNIKMAPYYVIWSSKLKSGWDFIYLGNTLAG